MRNIAVLLREAEAKAILLNQENVGDLIKSLNEIFGTERLVDDYHFTDDGNIYQTQQIVYTNCSYNPAKTGQFWNSNYLFINYYYPEQKEILLKSYPSEKIASTGSIPVHLGNSSGKNSPSLYTIVEENGTKIGVYIGVKANADKFDEIKPQTRSGFVLLLPEK
ncbi:hypothetical protein HZA96_01095 [Candidatus Woesearchaeota archaeon]|nr:hypothetical protein [Candidatus Woesearchaeota archaeon]